jgi:alpha/beta superfamily hydrolase
LSTPADTFTEEQVQFASGPNMLEGIFAYPDADEPEVAVLLLSPHPHMGGRMDNNVIAFLGQQLAAEGCATLRFNYAGVGGSTLELAENDSPYEYWARLEAGQNYRAVVPDAVAARKFLLAALPGVPIGYVGYSFGSCLSVLLAGLHPPAWLAALAPPVARAPMVGMGGLAMPCRFIAGDKDFAFNVAEFDPLYAQVPGEKDFVLLPGCDHFFRKREAEVLSAIRPLLERPAP